MNLFVLFYTMGSISKMRPKITKLMCYSVAVFSVMKYFNSILAKDRFTYKRDCELWPHCVIENDRHNDEQCKLVCEKKAIKAL